MSFFNRLFGKKDIKSKPGIHAVKEPETTLKTELILIEKSKSHPQAQEVPKDYNISEIKKQTTQIKNQDGFLAAVNFIKDFISTKDVEFKELISLLKKVVPYMKKEKTIEDSEIISYIEKQIDKFSTKADLEHQTDIADLFSRVDNLKAIEYLENYLGGFETDKNKTLDHFDSLIQLSDFYLSDRQSDKAFQTVSRATQLVTNFNDKFDYLWKHKIIAEKCAAICLKERKKPKYADYLYYEILSFILEIARGVTYVPVLSSFFYRKNICFNEGWRGFEENPDFDKALKDLNIQGHKKALLNDIYEFAFNDLPIKMGIPKEYLIKDLHSPTNNLIDYNGKKHPEWENILAFQEEFEERPFDISLPHEFLRYVVKKYYDQ